MGLYVGLSSFTTSFRTCFIRYLGLRNPGSVDHSCKSDSQIFSVLPGPREQPFLEVLRIDNLPYG